MRRSLISSRESSRPSSNNSQIIKFLIFVFSLRKDLIFVKRADCRNQSSSYGFSMKYPELFDFSQHYQIQLFNIRNQFIQEGQDLAKMIFKIFRIRNNFLKQFARLKKVLLNFLFQKFVSIDLYYLRMSLYQQNGFQDSYRVLANQYGKDEIKLIQMEQQISEKKQAHDSFQKQLLSAQKQLEKIISRHIYKDDQNGNRLNEAELKKVLETFSSNTLRIETIQQRGYANTKSMEKELNQLQQKLENIKKSRSFKQQDLSPEKIKSIDLKISAIQASIYQIQEKIDQKLHAREYSNQIISIKEELADFQKLESKLREELALKQAEQNVEKQKLVIEHGKLTGLQIQFEEKQQTYKSLVKHYQQIKERVSALKRQKRMLTKQNQKQKNLPAKYPVREQISIFQRQNQLLQKELEREKQKLIDYQQLKVKSISQIQMTNKRQMLQILKNSQTKIKQQIQQNKILKEELKNIKQNLDSMKEVEKSMIKEKKKKMRVCKQKISEYEEQKINLEIEIERIHQKLLYYSKIHQRRQQHRLNYEQLQSKSLKNEKNSKNLLKQKQVQKQINNQYQNKGFLGRLKQDTLESFTNWTTHLSINKQNLTSLVLFLFIFFILVYMISQID